MMFPNFLIWILQTGFLSLHINLVSRVVRSFFWFFWIFLEFSEFSVFSIVTPHSYANSVTCRAAHRRCTVLYSSMHTPSPYCTTLYCASTVRSIPIGSPHYTRLHSARAVIRVKCATRAHWCFILHTGRTEHCLVLLYRNLLTTERVAH